MDIALSQDKVKNGTSEGGPARRGRNGADVLPREEVAAQPYM